MAQAFLPTRKPNAAIIGITAGSVQLPPSLPFNQGRSAYNSSKIAQLKLLENLAAENPDVFVASVHPGVVMTEMSEDADAHALSIPIDDSESARLSFAVLFLVGRRTSSRVGCFSLAR